MEERKGGVPVEYEFINRMQNRLKLTKDGLVTLVIGNTGSGKSTLVHYVAGDYSKLESIETEIDYIVRDGLDPEAGDIVSTTESRTLVPEMVIDEAGNVWYDCPGFGDTRSKTIELATAILIRSVIENASNVKIVFVVNYGSVTESYDRIDLDNSMRRATELIKNIDRYKKSVSLVVSKVPPYIVKKGRAIEIFENDVKMSAANYMSGYRSVQQKTAMNESKIQLIDALLEKTPNGDYPKISIFWRPSEAGAFNTIVKMVEGREKIRKSILRDTSYTKIDPNDFGFPLTDGARIYIGEMAQFIMENLTELLMSIDGIALSAFRQKVESINDFRERSKLLTIAKKSIQMNSENIKSLDILTKRFIDLAESFNFSSSFLKPELDRIKEQEKNLNILKSISQKEFPLPICDWIAKIVQTSDYITSEHLWYSFLVQVFDFFASYEVQRNVAKYNVADIADWGQLNKPQGLQVDADNFIEFTRRFPGCVEVTPTTSKLKELNEMIDFTLKSPPKYECNGETLTIKGNFVKASDIQPTKCSSNRISTIKVFVVNTFYVDSDLNLNGYHGLNIFADKWIITQPTTFNLNGSNGKAKAPLRTSGTAGNPGNPGTNGGNFIGLWNYIVNGDSLTVNLNGGAGGAGQDGTGSSDIEPEFNPGPFQFSDWGLFRDVRMTHLDLLKCGNNLVEKIKESSYSRRYFALLAAGFDYDHSYRIRSGQRVGPTGLGGNGGIGGNAGNYVFLHTGINKNVSPKCNAVIGSRGNNGQDAAPCKETVLEINAKSALHKWVAVVVPMHRLYVEFVVKGRVVLESRKIRSTVQATQPNPAITLKFTQSLMEYKFFLRDNMKNSPLATIQNAHYVIDLNADNNRAYSVADFVVELTTLEEQFHGLNEYVHFMPFYENLLTRIECYAIENKEQCSSWDRKVLALLHTTTLSKMVSMRSGRQIDLHIDIDNCFSLISRNIRKRSESAHIRLIEEQRDKCNENLQAKIGEANDYIQNNVIPEIERLLSALDSEFQKTVSETVALRTNTTEGTNKKQENVKKIRTNIMIHKVMEVVCETISLLAGQGKIITEVISTSSEIAKQVFIEQETQQKTDISEKFKKNDQKKIDESEFDKSNECAVEAVEERVKPENSLVPYKALHKVGKFFENCSTAIAGQIFAEQETRQKTGITALVNIFQKTTSEKFKNSDQQEIDAIECKLEKSIKCAEKLIDLNAEKELIRSKNPFVQNEVLQILREFIDIIRKQEQEAGTAQIVQQLHEAQNALPAVENPRPPIWQFSTDIESLDVIVEAINEDRNSLLALVAFEDQIYADIMPMINGLQANLNDVKNNLVGKSPVAFDVEHWKICNQLPSVKRKLVESISGFKNEYDVGNCVEQIEEAFKFIIDIYDRIQNCQEQSRFAIHLRALLSADYRNFYDSNVQLKKNLNHLRFRLQENIILSQYNRAVVAFKQAVFPFAADHLAIYQLPASFAADKNLNVVVKTAARKLELLRKRFMKLNTTVINRNDTLIRTANFGRNSDGCQPFYVWPNAEIQDKIQHLFAGKKIFLLADVKRSSYLNAVKFNRIDLQFQSSNQSTNDQLKLILQRFHIALTHMGESNYRCNQQFYTISSPPQTIEYSYAENANTPIFQNLVYDKLRSGVKLLSPYTLWAIQLKNGPFDELKPFAGSVDIELHGHGQYVVEDAEICKTDLGKYYTHMDIH